LDILQAARKEKAVDRQIKCITVNWGGGGRFKALSGNRRVKDFFAIPVSNYNEKPLLSQQGCAYISL